MNGWKNFDSRNGCFFTSREVVGINSILSKVFIRRNYQYILLSIAYQQNLIYRNIYD